MTGVQTCALPICFPVTIVGTGKTTIHPQIKPLAEKIMLTFPELPIMTFLGNNTRNNQDAVVRCMQSLLDNHSDERPIEKPMAYLDAAMRIENGKHNARDHDRESQEHKRPIGKTGMETIGEIFRKAGVKG